VYYLLNGQVKEAFDALESGLQGRPQRADLVVTAALGISGSAAKGIVDKLQADGYVERKRGRTPDYVLCSQLPAKPSFVSAGEAGGLSEQEVRTQLTALLLQQPISGNRRTVSLRAAAMKLGIKLTRLLDVVERVKANKVLLLKKEGNQTYVSMVAFPCEA